MRAYPRERFSSEMTLSPAMVVEFANAAGDNNPIHHDAEFAATTRFGRPTASGPHTAALLLALTASHFSKKGRCWVLNSGFGSVDQFSQMRQSFWNGWS